VLLRRSPANSVGYKIPGAPAVRREAEEEWNTNAPAGNLATDAITIADSSSDTSMSARDWAKGNRHVIAVRAQSVLASGRVLFLKFSLRPNR
jgi:hypothetical protein